jgi:hypothetical protein
MKNEQEFKKKVPPVWIKRISRLNAVSATQKGGHYLQLPLPLE